MRSTVVIPNDGFQGNVVSCRTKSLMFNYLVASDMILAENSGKEFLASEA